MSKSHRFHREVDGILLFDKPLGLSSNAALQQVRTLFGARKAGHAGSLDPLASGLLPVCFGQATKVCGRLLNAGKTYRVRVALGARTESGDAETPIVEHAAIPELTIETVDAALARFMGEQQQIPPMHSALKHAGERLYELARRGESVERPARTIVIHRIQRIGLTPDTLEFDVYCSKGTYIRTLAADVARALGTLGYVESLRRLSLDPFDGLHMYSLSELEALSPSERDAVLLGADSAFQDLPRIELDRAGEHQLLQGQSLLVPGAPVADDMRAYGPGKRFLGLVSGAAGGRIRPGRLFVDPKMPPSPARGRSDRRGPDSRRRSADSRDRSFQGP
ncbi:hypothetical protein ACG33_06970 [Steroidobacter denitrificans]|uniref:tRNA pseudouridine synthase B n=1 Tax=Steroidobacter denitrificans TaxID=465721 RepID=A0A127F8T3_STEDE|nr:tRNA pseudouridine(55) synthase TruB [Steroidobacter denitrificans]AMN46843.1 hypothetical protein ACG33_06970 [Steroidobacter denitrificans]